MTASTPPPQSRRSMRAGFAGFAVFVAVLGASLAAGSAAAQTPGWNPLSPNPSSPWPTTGPGGQPLAGVSPSGVLGSRPAEDPNAQMLVNAVELNYDYVNQRVSAVGKVQIYYQGATLEADKVTYDQKTKRLLAEGNVRLTERDGKIITAEMLNLSDQFRDGFLDSLRLEAPDRTRFIASRADREGGNFTIFQSGVYTACEPCKDDPRKPPLWQVRAARIIHDEADKMIYFEKAQLEFAGVPIGYVPFFSAPDPTVKRKTGFLMPRPSTSSKYGFGLEVPFFWAIAPDYDLTFSPIFTTKQGIVGQAEWRQRLLNGAYTVRAAGIFQQDKDYFLRGAQPATPGYYDSRGAVQSSGQFALSDRWIWGWDGTLMSDKTFFQDYGLTAFLKDTDPFKYRDTAAISQLYLTGVGDRSYFDMRAIHYFGFSEADVQKQIPFVHPVIDYSYVFGTPILGGEAGYRLNFTSLSRISADFDPISQTAFERLLCEPLTADPAQKIPANCLLRGVPGTYTRFSAEANWRRTFIDPFGQMFTPFVKMRADLASVNIQNEAGVANFINPGEETVGRFMPTVGVEYRYPFISAHSWGSQTLEPIVQLIARPNETAIRKLPNEDAQSLIFDDSNLLRVDKFSGWDRVEGGGRANYALQYTAQFNQGGFVNVLFGQSYQLFGQNSFATPDLVNTGIGSGLDTTASDYVARMSYQPNSVYTLSTRFRFDHETFDVRRFELEGKANFDRWSVLLLYGNYDKQPELGFLTRREGVLAGGSVKLTQNWNLMGTVRYDIDAAKINQLGVGLGYIDDCFAISVNYISDYTYSGNPQIEQKVLLQISLRTLGGTSFTQKVAGVQ